MSTAFTKIPKKYQPKGFEIIYEDRDIIVGNKAPGILSVGAKWEREVTVHHALNQYIRKGSAHSKKAVFVVHRLDQATSGLLVFAKTQEAQEYLKDHWYQFDKYYYAIVHGKMPKKSGLIQSYLEEDEDYVMHSSENSEKGKLAKTEYQVLKETSKFSLLKIHLLTGRKNQIRVHTASVGCPVVGDVKYGDPESKQRNLALHSFTLEINHPFSEERLTFEVKPPNYFSGLLEYPY